MSKVKLFDLPSKGRPACWSLNPWKPRMALNYKGIPYTTEWVEYPDLAPTMERLGIQPNSTSPRYSSPAVQFTDDGTYVMDSKSIAKELERRFPAPSPSLHLDSPYVKRMEEAMPKITKALEHIWKPAVPVNLLPERSKEYFERTRAQALGISLAEFARQDDDEAWARAAPGFGEVAHMLGENKGGPFLMGKELCYADIMFVTMLHFFRRVDEGMFQRAVAADESISSVYEASKQWLEKDD